MTEILLRKLGIRDRADVLTRRLHGTVDVLIRTAKPLTPTEHADLTDSGFEPRFSAGNVVGGAVRDATDLEAVAELPFVDRIELSRALYLDG